MKLVFSILFLIFCFSSGFAQSKADRLFERGNYLEALKAYQKEAENLGEEGGKEKGEFLKARVANCLFRLNDVVRAGQVYKTLNTDLMGVEDLTFYATTLIRSGDYDKAAGLIDMVESLGGDMLIVERLRGSCEFAKEVVKEKPVYSATKQNINFEGFSSGVTYYKGNGIILAAPGAGENAVKDSRGYKVTRLYNVLFSGTGGRMVPFAEGLVDKYHIGAVSFTKDFKRIYYTRTILKNDGTSILKLMTAEEVDGKWENIEELNINSDDYSCAHPCLFQDSLLFFVSDMPGGMGGKDIYVTTVEGAQCGEIQNLGETINTMFDELFPFVDTEGKLYFASNGHVGLGGLDVFVSEMDENGAWTTPENMGRPINSSMDDFGLVFKDTKCAEGYVSSNRGGTGYNDFLFSLRLLPNRKAAKREMAKVSQEKVQGTPALSVDYRHAIQIGAFRNPVPRVYFQNFQNVKVYLGYDNVYRYTVGEYPDESIAQNDLKEVRKMIGDAFVISVERYVAQRKIQHDVKGDDLADNELLLRRLKNFERMKQQRPVAPVNSKRYLDKPKESELGYATDAYTIVLMSADDVLNEEYFNNLEEVDVYAVEGGRYMYCSGLFATPAEAMGQLKSCRDAGFPNARIVRTNAYEFYSEVAPAPESPVSDKRRNSPGLKELLTF